MSTGRWSHTERAASGRRRRTHERLRRAVVASCLDEWSDRVRRASVLTTLVVWGAYGVHVGSRIRFADEADYLAIAHNLATGRGFTIDGRHATAYRAPGLPLLLAPFRLVGVPVTGLRLVMVGLLATTVWLAWHLADALGGRVAGAGAAVLSAWYPLQVFTATTFYPETLATTLLTAGAFCIVRADRAVRPNDARRALAVGSLSLSAAILTAPPYGVACLIILGWFAWRHRRPAIRLLVWGAAPLLLPILLWSGRNAVALHAFVPATTGSGYNLLLGNSPHASPDSGVATDITQYHDVALRRGLDEVAVDHYYASSAIDWMRAHPGHALWLWAEKTAHYFDATSKVATSGESSPLRDLLAELTYYPLLLALVVRLGLARRYRLPSEEVMLLACYMLTAPAMGVFVTRVRYRVPMDELLIVLLAAWCAAVLTGPGRRVTPRSGTSPPGA